MNLLSTVVKFVSTLAQKSKEILTFFRKAKKGGLGRR